MVPVDDLAEEAFVVLREALKRSHKIGLGQLAMRGREYVVSIKACGRGMVMETLRYADEVHKAASYFHEIGETKPDDDLLDLAQTLIDKKTGTFDASDFHDRYVDALKELIEEKRKGKTIKIDDDKAADPRQPVSSHCRSKRGDKGYDAGKKITGRKRHILTDTDGRLLTVRVHGADVQDRDGGRLPLKASRQRFPFVARVFADGG